MNAMSLTGLVFIGGGIGATLRYVLSLGINNLTTKAWAGTLFVNLVGCLIYFLLVKLGLGDRPLQSFLKVGLLGSLTTFSTFTFELVELIKLGRFTEAALVLSLNIVFGIIIGVGILR